MMVVMFAVIFPVARLAGALGGDRDVECKAEEVSLRLS
jgi:hypothetical protein